MSERKDFVLVGFAVGPGMDKPSRLFGAHRDQMLSWTVTGQEILMHLYISEYE